MVGRERVGDTSTPVARSMGVRGPECGRGGLVRGRADVADAGGGRRVQGPGKGVDVDFRFLIE